MKNISESSIEFLIFVLSFFFVGTIVIVSWLELTGQLPAGIGFIICFIVTVIILTIISRFPFPKNDSE